MAGVRFGPVAALLAIGCAAAAMGLALQHPLSPALAVAFIALSAAWAAWRPFWVPVGLLALLPVAGLAPWTGWMLAEEFDLLLLALLAGGWARLAWPAGLPPVQAASDGVARVWWLLALPYVGLTAVSAWRGLHDAGAWAGDVFAWGWWQGWREPMNVLRTAKPSALVLLAWPLWQALQSRRPDQSAGFVGQGAVAGLAVVALVATWERWVWTDLTDFSTDYRTTALFWETHTGGAALDAFLALTLPFGLAAATARSRLLAVISTAVLCVAAYAVLTTFSRGLYLGVAIGTLLWWAATPKSVVPPAQQLWLPMAWTALFGAMATVVFPIGGWRGLGALWGLFALAFWAWRKPGWTPRWSELVMVAAVTVLPALALMVGAVSVSPAWRAPYLLFAVLGAWALWAWWRPEVLARWRQGWVAWLAAAMAAAGVWLHWGESSDFVAMLGVAAVLAVAVACGMAVPTWRGMPGGRWRMATLGAMGVVGLIVGSFVGGAYLGGRLAAAEHDWQVRWTHWTRALSLANDEGATWWGIGPGRFAAHFAFSGETTDQTGDYRWQPATHGGGQLVLTSGKHMLGFGELFRMSQRIDSPVGAVTVRWRAEVDAPAGLHVEICSKHLLYDAGCQTKQVKLGGTFKAPGLGWQSGELTLPAASSWRQPVFSVAVDTRGGRVVIDRLEVIDSTGRSLLHNGGFDEGLARWLPSSDRHHLPWHAKNLFLHLRIEQGWLGLCAFAAMLTFALVRLTVGRARRHPLAPPLLAGIVGFLIVGLFDSLLDIPRVAFAFLFLLGVAATLRAPPPGQAHA